MARFQQNDHLGCWRKCESLGWLAHQYFEQLDEDITAAALNNCQIKAVFGKTGVHRQNELAALMARILL